MAKRKKSSPNELKLIEVKPLTKNQELAFKSKKNMVLCGSAGSGKSLIACYLGFKGVAEEDFNSITIIRSAVPTRDIGYLPGTESDKIKIYEEPYYALCSEIFNRGDAYELMKKKGIINFSTTSFLRGLTFKYSFIVIDECQNLDFGELNTIMTRIGEGCRVLFCGDFKQSDLKDNGLKTFLNILKSMKDDFDIIEFNIEDIVRSGLVKRYLQTVNRIEHV
jgi:predicted ribonuclease YlaK